MSLIGVVIPVLDRPEPLRRAVESVLRQRGVSFHLVVMDDGSVADLSDVERLVREEGHTWNRLDANQGPAEARNRGVTHLPDDWEWVTFLDSDDTWREGKLATQRDWHGENPGIRISQVTEQWIRGGEVVAKPAPWAQKGGDLFADSVERCSIGPSCVMMHRDLWKEAGGFDPRYPVCEDYELWLRITARERIGLAGSEPLVEKLGGQPDQLSFTTPAMDRYRVVALLELMASGILTPGQSQVAREGALQKSTILEQGARKRGNTARADFYLSLRESGIEDPEEWIRGAWEQCD